MTMIPSQLTNVTMFQAPQQNIAATASHVTPVTAAPIVQQPVTSIPPSSTTAQQKPAFQFHPYVVKNNTLVKTSLPKSK